MKVTQNYTGYWKGMYVNKRTSIKAGYYMPKGAYQTQSETYGKGAQMEENCRLVHAASGLGAAVPRLKG